MNVHDFTVKDNKGNEVSLSEYKGKVLLIVNTATKCGLTPQYDGLEALYEKYHDQGFEILDFPCNQFAFQAPGNAEQIDSFCTMRFNTKFPRFEKIKVNGKEADPLYVFLKSKKPGRIQWNFAKFLIDRDGNVVDRFAPTEKPENLEARIEQVLNGQDINAEESKETAEGCEACGNEKKSGSKKRMLICGAAILTACVLLYRRRRKKNVSE